MSKKPIIVFEGIEGSGKSHHISVVSKYLTKKKINHIKIREPGGNPNSEKIRKLILNNKSNFNQNTDLLLYMAARSENVDLIKKFYNKKKVRNAWCMPGGKIAVYTGILDATKNTNGLAAVMGHEIAHAVAKHSVERASRGTLLNVGTRIIDIASGGVLSDINRTTGQNTVGLLTQLGILNPFNRKQESEADYLGMIFSSLSGYDIRETVKIWERMKELNKGKEPPEFMSTHPSSDNRIKNLNEKMNEVILDYPPIKLT
ncbi:M48 family metalloprotease [Candidatus Pelagibacter sp.]|nr:M48 family metalloprotease [Candidatus Pelagibacter sp.]